MELFAPLYYLDFKCICGACKNSCCVRWEIELDGETMDKYSTLPKKTGEKILSKIEYEDGAYHIRLDECQRCPFLNDGGLCEIISELGEEYTSKICRRHPRFYNRIGDRYEVGLGAVCEEACRLILSGNSRFASVGESEIDVGEETDFDTLELREEIFSITENTTLSYREKQEKIKERFSLSSLSFSECDTEKYLSQAELLDESHRPLLSLGKSEKRGWVCEILIRYFNYLLFRHASIAESYQDMRARVAFCLLLTSMLENATSYKENLTFSDICELARAISEEIEYSEENTEGLIFALECELFDAACDMC